MKHTELLQVVIPKRFVALSTPGTRSQMSQYLQCLVMVRPSSLSACRVGQKRPAVRVGLRLYEELMCRSSECQSLYHTIHSVYQRLSPHHLITPQGRLITLRLPIHPSTSQPHLKRPDPRTSPIRHRSKIACCAQLASWS